MPEKKVTPVKYDGKVKKSMMNSERAANQHSSKLDKYIMYKNVT